VLVSHCFAQSQALMQGKTVDEAYQELTDGGMGEKQSRELAPHKSMEGNKPNNVIMLEELSPKNMGALLALYEHKVVAQGIIWNINSFDQWGVELGKQLSKPVYQSISENEVGDGFDCSTQSLIQKYLK
jgi:glucose-6-phosphate isomerase